MGAVLEGGYDLYALADSVARRWRRSRAAGRLPPEVARHPLAEDAAEVLGRYWDL